MSKNNNKRSLKPKRTNKPKSQQKKTDLDYYTVKIPIMTDYLTDKKLRQLEIITRRDTSVIIRYLDIIHDQQNQLWKIDTEGNTIQKIDPVKLDHLTLTSNGLKRRNKKTGVMVKSPARKKVQFNLKHEFGFRITVRELKECRDTAIAMYHSYLTKQDKHEATYWKFHFTTAFFDSEDESALASKLSWWETQKKPARPNQASNYKPHKLPRIMNQSSCQLYLDRTEKKGTQLSSYWVELYATEKRTKIIPYHLWLPLNPSDYHLEQLKLGKAKAFRLVKKMNGCWMLHVSLEPVETKIVNIPEKPPAVLGGDLGMNRTLVTVLLKPGEPVTHQDIRMFSQPFKRKKLNQLDKKIARLQGKQARRKALNKNYKNIVRCLKEYRHTRKELSEHYDHELSKEVALYIAELSQKYDLQVSIGKLKGIRNSRWRGDGKSKQHRKQLHRWTYFRMTTFMSYKFIKVGLSEAQFTFLNEAMTSKTCSKCGSRNTSRPCQAILLCHDSSCGAILNADINAAINMASKLIVSQLLKLSDNDKNQFQIAFDQWSTNIRVQAWMGATGMIRLSEGRKPG